LQFAPVKIALRGGRRLRQRGYGASNRRVRDLWGLGQLFARRNGSHRRGIDTACERSIWPTSRSLLSSTACRRSHTRAFCQACSRRQQVAPEPKPSLVGRWFHRGLSSTRTGCLLRRGFGGGSNGWVSIHSSSSITGASIPLVPLLRKPRLAACRERTAPHGIFELAS
jgi:hypothetical protein